MSRYLAVAAIAVLMCAGPAFAADDAQTPPAGGADTSTGAKRAKFGTGWLGSRGGHVFRLLCWY